MINKKIIKRMKINKKIIKRMKIKRMKIKRMKIRKKKRTNLDKYRKYYYKKQITL